MRRATLVLVTIALAACGTAHGQTSTQRATAGAATCAPAGAHVLASDRAAAVYSVKGGGLKGAVYACDARNGKRIKLGNASLCIGTARVDRAALAGEVLAYGLERCGIDTGGASVVVKRLSDGKQLKNYPAATTGILVESYQSVSSLVVRRDGAVAWIAVVNSIIGRGTNVAVYRNGSVLDAGPGVAPGSMSLRGAQLSWRHGSSTRTAALS